MSARVTVDFRNPRTGTIPVASDGRTSSHRQADGQADMQAVTTTTTHARTHAQTDKPGNLQNSGCNVVVAIVDITLLNMLLLNDP